MCELWYNPFLEFASVLDKNFHLLFHVDGGLDLLPEVQPLPSSEATEHYINDQPL
jgi:hypothetical protein